MTTVKYSALAALFIFTFYFFLPQNAPSTPPNPSSAQWGEDIDVLQRELEARHINLYHSTSKEAFSTQLAAIKNQLPELSQAQLIVELMRSVKMIGDGHTQLSYWGGPHHRFPLEFKLFASDLRVIATDSTHKNILGMRLHSINEVPVVDLVAKVKPILMGVENVWSEMHQLASTLPVAEVLLGLDIIDNTETARFAFIDDQGKVTHVNLQSLPSEKFQSAVVESLEPPLPAGFTLDNKIDGLTLYLNKNRRVAYLDFDHYPSFSSMQNFAGSLKNIFSKEGVRYVIIDFRQNGGGDFFVGLALAWGLIVIDSLDWQNGFYVLTSGNTFSAAMSNAAQYRQILNATLVGEPTGANPVGYQDADTFVLPNSGWKVMYSKRYYLFQESSSEGVQPDVLLAPDWQQFRAGTDNQLQWILNKIAGLKK
jgi:hypothetical protein